jgi:hypothetical protein
MSAGCNLPDDSAAQMRADAAWLAQMVAFAPEASPPSLRVADLREETEQVLLAKSGLRRTCSDYRAGKLSQADADNILSGFEQTIRDFVHDRGNDALVRAGAGQVAQMDSIRKALTTVAGVGRQAALLGLDPIANDAHATMVKTLNVFDSAFAKDCKNQSFDPDIVLGLLRQEYALGLKNPLEPCAYRLAKLDFRDARQGWSIHHCGLGYGEWKFQGSGWLTGSGTGQTDVLGNGNYSVRYARFNRFETTGAEEGTLKFYCTPEEACKCVRDQSSESCKKQYRGQVPPTQWFLDFGLKSISGSIKMQNATIPFATVMPRGAFAFQKQTPVVYLKFDKPCDPDQVPR